MNAAQYVQAIAASLAVVWAAYLTLRKDKPKNDADAVSTAVHDALSSLQAALTRANHDVEGLREQLRIALLDVARLSREVAVLQHETDALQRQLGAKDVELARLRKGLLA